MRSIRQFARDRRGGTTIEYGLICALIIIGIMSSLLLFAGTAVNMLNHVSTEVANATANVT